MDVLFMHKWWREREREWWRERERERGPTGRRKKERVISGSSAPVKICNNEERKRERERETKETTRGRWLFKAGMWRLCTAVNACLRTSKREREINRV